MSPAAFERATGVPQLLRALSASDPGRPRLTWYDDAPGATRGERIELSARVLATWVAKAANLLVDELGVEPGDRVVVDLPVHWRAAYWLLAGWSAGAEVVVTARGRDGARPDVADARVWVSDDPATAGGSDTVLAVTLPALARSWPGPGLPAGVVDEAASVTGQPDLFEPLDQPRPTTTALRLGGRSLDYAGLLPAAREAARGAGWPVDVRLLTSTATNDPVAGLLAPLLLDGSLVLVREPDPSLLDRRRADERVTAG